MLERDYKLFSRCSIDVPLVSVIVPVYNMEQNGFLVSCLDSLIAQDLDALEIICIDDASTDNSLKLLCDYACRHSNITVVQMRANSGQGAARNRGIDLARGKYIGMVDADDFVDHGFFSSLYKEAQRAGAMVVEAPIQLVDERGGVLGSAKLYYPCELAARELTERERERLILEHPHGVQCLFKSSLLKLETSRFLEGMAYEDTPTGVRWVEHIGLLSQVHDVAYYYRQNSSSTTHTTTIGSKKMSDRLKSAEMIIDDAVRLGYYDRYRRALNQYYLRVYYFNTIVGIEINKVFTNEGKAFVSALSSRARSKVSDWARVIWSSNISIGEKLKKLWLLGSPLSFLRAKAWKQRLKGVLCG